MKKQNPIGQVPLCELAKGKKTITIVTSDHTRAVPSKLTLPILLREIRKGSPDADITIFLQAPADVFDFLPGREKVNITFVGINDFDVYIALDSGDVKRLGDAEPFFVKAKKTICIDHHASNTGYGDVCLVEGDASSTCEVLYELFEKEYIDDAVATCLYTGIIHDTGVLQYSNTSKLTFDIVGELKNFDIDTSKIIDETFYEKTKLQNEMLGRALVESITFADGKCIVSKIDRKIMDFYGATPHEFEGIVNQLRYTKGVEVAIFMYEIDNMEYKVSLRSRGLVDVAKIAKFYNGGGHQRAAGFTIKGTFHDCVNNISDSIMIQMSK